MQTIMNLVLFLNCGKLYIMVIFCNLKPKLYCQPIIIKVSIVHFTKVNQQKGTSFYHYSYKGVHLSNVMDEELKNE